MTTEAEKNARIAKLEAVLRAAIEFYDALPFDHAEGEARMLDRMSIILAEGERHVRRVRHRKRGTLYEVLGEASVQISVSDSIVLNTLGLPIGRLLMEGGTLTVYRSGEDGSLWARFSDEFEDGRFEEAPCR